MAALRPSLFAEFLIYSLQQEEAELVATVGIADAITGDPKGLSTVEITWKSGVNPSQETLDRYRAQVRTYLDMTGAERGLIILMTSGTAMIVSPSASA